MYFGIVVLGLQVPSSSATGDWLYRVGRGTGIDELRRVNNDILKLGCREISEKNLTLDIDATGIASDKYGAKYTYKGFKGYMPVRQEEAEKRSCFPREIGRKPRMLLREPTPLNKERGGQCIKAIKRGENRERKSLLTAVRAGND